MLAVAGEKRSYDIAFQGDEDQDNSIPSNGRKCMRGEDGETMQAEQDCHDELEWEIHSEHEKGRQSLEDGQAVDQPTGHVEDVQNEGIPVSVSCTAIEA